MANLFEKPIAANPLSQFVELPLGFMDQLLERRQQRYDAARAEMAAQEDSLLKMKYLQGDAERHHQIQAEYDKRLNDMVESAGGDYSRLQPQIDIFTRDLKREMAYGELGYQQRAFDSAAKFREDLDKNLADGKVSEEGYNMALSSIASHKTIPNGVGSFTSFTGYTPSTVVDPYKDMLNLADEIVAKYNDAGMKYVDRKLILDNLDTQIQNNSALGKALREKLYTQFGPDVTPEQAQQFINRLKESVVTAKRFEEVPQLKDASGNVRRSLPPQTLFGWQQPDTVSGSIGYTGASVPFWRDVFSAIGANAWGEFQNSIQKPEVQNRIRYIEKWKSNGEKFPTNPADQAAWLEKWVKDPKVGEIQTEQASIEDMNMIDAQGFFINPSQVAVRDRSGKYLDADEIKNIQGGVKSGSDTRTGSMVAMITQRVKSGGMNAPGSLIMRGSDGEEYIVENKSPKLINSVPFNNSLIDMASSTNTGYLTGVTLRTDVEHIPAGTYDVEHVPVQGAYDNYNLYQNGVLKYKKFRGADGLIHTMPVNQ